MTKDPLEPFRRDAKTLKAAFEAGDADARARVASVDPGPGADLKHADYLHVIARENTFVSWPAMKAAIEAHGLDRAQKLQRLKAAVHNGHTGVAVRLLADTPDLASGQFGLLCALYDHPAVAAMLEADPKLAVTLIGPWSPLIHLCKSKMHSVWTDRQDAALAIAELLVAQGADVNAGSLEYGDPLSPLYWALGYAGNLPLAGWLLKHGADPNDGESLYHATELGHADGLTLLLQHGADPKGTNALPRAMDFDDADMVRMLLEGGADPNEGSDAWTQGTGVEGGVPVLHQAARRMNTARVLDALLDHGADVNAVWKGLSAYAFAAVFGNRDLAERLVARGADQTLTRDEALLAQAARGEVGDGFIDPDKLPDAYRNILREIVHLPDKLPHLKALVAIGLEWDRPDAEGLTPVQVAGWMGLPEVMGYFLSLKPDLSHVNGYDGTLFSTILHGADNNPDKAKGDYVGCLQLVLEEGVALPRKGIEAAGDPAIRAFLRDWAIARPGQVVEHGVV
ncbi:MAG: ankyrin repeat domain-containing protein [Pseudomonadota bacterium]